MAVGDLGEALIEIGESRLNYLVYVALLQVNMFLGIDFIQKKGVQFHCSKGEFRVGASLTNKPMFKANSPLVQVFSVRHVRLSPFSVGMIDCEITGEMSDFIHKPIDEFPKG